ncbi:MAG: efflux transporter outer membrane subunit [Caulobacteraceae bacterium]|nr:efflux transporter outer membrane subunit [Caulobacteraceae bacterium]
MSPSRLKLAAGLVAASALAGCTLDPAYQRPAAPVPSAWPTGAAYPSTSGQATIAGWRDVVTDARLKQVVEQALANNRDLRIAVANMVAARAQYHVQRADLFPAITANASATYAGEPASAVTGGSGTGRVNEHLYSASVGFSSYELDLFGRVRSLTRAAQEQYFASEEARRAAQISLVAEVAGDWLTLGADRTLLKIAQDTQASDAESLAITQRRLDAGVATALDVAEARTALEQARSDVAADITQVAQDRNALELVVGAPVADALLPDGLDETPPVAETPAGVSSTVLLRRPDVVEAEDQLKAQNANIGAARAAFFPTISLTGSGGGSSTALSRLFSSAAGAWSFAPSISLPLFEGGKNIANLAYAKAERDSAVATYEKSIQTAFREVADALARRGTIDEQLAAQKAESAAAEDALRLSTARYERGSDTYLNLLISQRTLYSARQTLVATQLARSTNLVTLYNALGGGWD